MTDGDGWTECSRGHRHWGRFGAAGLLVVTTTAPASVLLQLRAPWSHGGDTWGVPGGARSAAESPVAAAHRETTEETQLDVALLTTLDPPHVADHGSWSYTTFVATVPAPLPVVRCRESTDLRWVPVESVEDLPLHPGFAAAWPELRQILPPCP